MKFAFCLYKYFPYGGLQRDFMCFLQEAAGRGHEVEVYCYSWQGEKPAGISVHLLPVKGWSNHGKGKHFHSLLMQALKHRPVDAVVGFNKMAGLDLYYAADSCYVDKALRERSWLYRLSPRYRFYARAEKAVFGAGSHTQILLISDIEKQKFLRHYATEEARMHMLPPGISRDRCAPQNAADIRRDLRAEFGLSEEDTLLLFVGSGFIKKGLDRAVAALASLKKQQGRTFLYVLGQDRKARYEARAESLGVGEQLKFLGGRDDVPRFLLGADLLVHPALDEAAGIVLLEAVVAGLPVIVTDVCGYAFHIDKAGCGRVLDSPFSQQAFNESVQQALDNPELRQQWKAKALDYAGREDLYSMHATGVDLMEGFVREKQGNNQGSL